MNLYQKITSKIGLTEEEMLVGMHFAVVGGIKEQLTDEADSLINELLAIINLRGDYPALITAIDEWFRRVNQQLRMIANVLEIIEQREGVDTIATVVDHHTVIADAQAVKYA